MIEEDDEIWKKKRVAKNGGNGDPRRWKGSGKNKMEKKEFFFS